VTAGNPVYSGGATYPTGTARLSANSTTPRLTFDYDQGTAVNWQNQAVGSANPNPPGNIPGMSQASLKALSRWRQGIGFRDWWFEQEQ